MYDAVADPYCYAGSKVLKNIPGLRNQRGLDEFEAAITAQRADEPFPRGHFSASHYRAIHRHLFQDIFTWAGRYRTVRIAKDGSAFCYPEHIDREMTELFAVLKEKRHFKLLPQERFAAEAAGFLSTLNAIHPFREGNGRSQMSFVTILAAKAGHPITLGKLKPARFLIAMVTSFKGDDGPLQQQLLHLTRPARVR